MDRVFENANTSIPGTFSKLFASHFALGGTTFSPVSFWMLSQLLFSIPPLELRDAAELVALLHGDRGLLAVEELCPNLQKSQNVICTKHNHGSIKHRLVDNRYC